ncbi:MAG: tetratricopeptide repeat protein [Terriglobales bacterium]
MNDTNLTQAVQKEFIGDIPEFPLELPKLNPFLVQTSATFREKDRTFECDFHFRDVTTSPASVESDLAESLVAERRRDLERFPNSIRARCNLASALLGQGRLGEAAEHLSTVLVSEPDNCLALGCMARIRLLQDNLAEARDLYIRLREVNPDDVSSSIGLAQIAVRREAFDEAVSLLKDAVSHPSDKPIARLHLAVLLLRLNRQHEAIRHLRFATQTAVRWPSLHEALGVAYVFNGDLQKAGKSFRAALTLFPDGPRALHGLGEVLYRQKRYDEAADVFHRAIQKEPDDAKNREILARVLEEQKEYRQAKQQLIEAKGFVDAKRPNQLSRIQNNIGVCTSLLDQAKAGLWFDRSIQTAPVRSPIPYLNAARSEIELGNWDSAIRALQLCRLQFPKAGPQIGTLLAICLWYQNKFQEAVKELRLPIQAGEGTAIGYSLLGLILTDNLYDYTHAIEVLKDGYKRYPGDACIGNNLAYAYLETGQPMRAEAILESIHPIEEFSTGAVALTATRGLLKLWQGDLNGGEEDYTRAEALARQLQDGVLAERVRQKRHLEVARFYERREELDAAFEEVTKGLKFKRPTTYREDLEAMKSQLESPSRIK